MENTGSLKSAVSLVRGAAAFAIFFFMRAVIFVLTMNVALDKDTQIFADFPLWSIGLVVVLGSLLLYNSVLRHLCLYARDERDIFLENPSVDGRFAEYSKIVKGRDFILGTAASLVLLAMLIPFGLFYEAEFLFESLGSARYAAIYAVYVTAFLFSGINARYETRRHWRQLYEHKDIEILDSRWRFILRGALILAIYPFAVPLSPILVFTAINVFTVVSAVLGLFSTVGLCVAAAILLFILLAKPKLDAVSQRRRFIKRLYATCERAGYELLDLRSERSLRLGAAGGLTFSLRCGDELYSCRLLAIEHKRRPIHFTSEGRGHLLYKLGTGKHFISLSRNFEYGFEGDGRRILILSPEPKHAFISSDGGERRLRIGDVMWGATVFEAESFFGAVDRRCLGHANKRYE